MTATDQPVDVPVTFLNAKPAATIPEPAEQLHQADAVSVRLFIGIPTYAGNVSVICAGSLIKLCEALKANQIEFLLKFHNGEMVARARNKIASEFRDSDYTHLLFVDSDIGFEAKDVLGMVAANVHLVGGVYPLKGYQWQSMAGVEDVAALPNIGLDYVTRVVPA